MKPQDYLKKEATTIEARAIKWSSILAGVIISAILIPLGLDKWNDVEETYRVTVVHQKQFEDVEENLDDLTDAVKAMAVNQAENLQERLISLELYTAEEIEEVELIQEKLNIVSTKLAEETNNDSKRNLEMKVQLRELNEDVIRLEQQVDEAPKMMIQQQAIQHLEKYQHAKK